MRAITRRLPTKASLEQNKYKLGGFAAGFFGPIILVGFFMAVWTGFGWGDEIPLPEQVYFF
jgi:hypothetical protein